MRKQCFAFAVAGGILWAAASAFEVATIKPALLSNPMDAMHGNAPIGMKIDAARVDIAGLRLMDLIRIAYGVKPYQIAAPEWMKGGQRWDIQATLPPGATQQQIPAMLEALLAERFKLAAHRETRDHAVYALVVGNGGPRMKESVPGDKPEGGVAAPHGSAMSMPITADAKNVFLTNEDLGPVQVSMLSGGAGLRLEAQKATMRALADMLSRMLDQPVIDMTGLKGKYEVVLGLTPDNMRTIATAGGFVTAGMGPGGRGPDGGMHDMANGADPAPTIFQSVQQLGLKLESRRAPMETIVVDRAEKKPTEN